MRLYCHSCKKTLNKDKQDLSSNYAALMNLIVCFLHLVLLLNLNIGGWRRRCAYTPSPRQASVLLGITLFSVTLSALIISKPTVILFCAVDSCQILLISDRIVYTSIRTILNLFYSFVGLTFIILSCVGMYARLCQSRTQTLRRYLLIKIQSFYALINMNQHNNVKIND